MKIRSNVKAGATINHNEKQMKSLFVKTGVKACGGLGGIGTGNHNEKHMKSLTVKSGVKAGGGDSWQNHNEKLSVNNNDSIERKGFSKKLSLKKETIRELKNTDLKAIAGGAMNNSFTVCYASGCCKP